MIRFELLKNAGVLVVEPKSALLADDFREISRRIDPKGQIGRDRSRRHRRNAHSAPTGPKREGFVTESNTRHSAGLPRGPL